MSPFPITPAGLYIHLPFCLSKCAYCDFNSVAGLEHLMPLYVVAVKRELERRSTDWVDLAFGSIYLGGGTPTLFRPSDVGALIETARDRLRFVPDAEVTLEANPGTVDRSRFQEWVAAGVNRISLGVQSLDDGELAMLGRRHDADEAVEAYRAAREAGVGNVSLDLIYGLPGQRLHKWQTTLDRAIELGPEHLSLYGLTVEPGTALADQIERGELGGPDQDAAADMYEAATDRLQEAGYAQYEISNWARRSSDDAPWAIPMLASRHNLNYWRNGLYLGVGAGAWSYDGERRSGNVSDPAEYISRVERGESIVVAEERLGKPAHIGETLMLGLRLNQGVTWEGFEARFGADLHELYIRQIRELGDQGLLEIDAVGVRLSDRGRLLGNRVFVAFLDSGSGRSTRS